MAALALAGGALLAAVPAAHAATLACGSGCASLYSQYLGTAQVSAVSPQLGVPFPPPTCRRSTVCGDAVVLAQASNSDPAEDFTASADGTVQQFAQAGLLSMNLTLRYATDEVYEFQYAPNGVPSGQCIGTFDKSVVLLPCGTNNQTLFVVDAANTSNGYSDLISGTTTTFSNPNVLTVGTTRNHTLTIATLSQNGTTVADTQMWTDQFGVLP
jgi:hypothetical protein